MRADSVGKYLRRGRNRSLMPSRRDEDESGRDSTKEATKGRKKTPSREYQTATRLSAVAVVLSVLARVVAFIAPGLWAPRNVMAQHSVGGPVTITSTCTHYPGAEVSISVPGAGTVVVSATVGVGINHESGVSDEARIVLATSSTECTFNNYTGVVSVPFSLPTDPYHYTTVPLLHPFSVDAAATVTFYVNGVMALGADSGDRFDSASLVAVYYPR
jgi:hypothetical protein